MRLLHFAQSVFLSPTYADDRSSVQAWRERALSATLFVIVFIGTIGYVFFLITDIVRGFQDRSYWAELPVDTIGYLILLGLALGRRLPFKVRAGGLLLALALLTLSDRIQAGLSGISELLLLTIGVLMVIFFGLKGGVAAIVLSVALMAIPGWLMTTGRIALPAAERANASGEVGAWALATVALVVLALMLVVSVATVMEGLQSRSAPQ